MTPSALLYTRLTAAPDLSALVGDRVFPVVIPQGQPFPAVRYQLISRDTNRVGRRCEPTQARLQITVYAASYDEMEAVELAAYEALDGYEADEESIVHLGATDGFEETTSPMLFTRTVDYRVTVPALPVS